jgi:tryptophanyl-tRNA synthetase
VQSHVPAHAQLARLLGSVATVGMLRRMIQFKEKSVKQGQDASLGLLDYPVLMAADILLYDADLVPVGADQKQHLELTRELAERFNRSYGEALLRLPEPLVVAETAKVMSLTDGSKKMSKSEIDDASRINLMDSADVIRTKVKRAKTDSIRGLEFDNPTRTEAHNLLALYQVLSGKSRHEVQTECATMGYGIFKPLLAEAIINELSPIQERYRALISDETRLKKILARGAEKASTVAAATLARVAAAMGLLQ